MLRITRIDTGNTDVVLLRLAGNVSAQWVDELRRACDDITDPGGEKTRLQLVLDLSDVLFVDARGLELFQDLRARSARFTNCSVFVAEQLKEAGCGRR